MPLEALRGGHFDVAVDSGGDVAKVAQVVMDAAQIVVLGGVMVAASAAMRLWRGEAELLGPPPAALGALARLVAEERAPQDVLRATVAEIGPLLGADATLMVGAGEDGPPGVLAAWSSQGAAIAGRVVGSEARDAAHGAGGPCGWGGGGDGSGVLGASRVGRGGRSRTGPVRRAARRIVSVPLAWQDE